MKKIITFGEIMLRLSTPGYQRFTQAKIFDVIYGGGESNVAVSLANYGLPTGFVTRLPKNEIGDSAIMELRKYGVDTSFILRGGDRIGIYFLEHGAVSRSSNVIYDRAGSAFAHIQPESIDWDAVFENAGWFHWTGITPAVSASTAAVCLEAVKAAFEKGLTISTDLNYRKKLWNYDCKPGEVMNELVSYSDIILGNEEDAHLFFGIEPEGVDVTDGSTVSNQAFEQIGHKMMAKFPKAKKIITTIRGSVSASHNSWSGILFDGKKSFYAPTYQITHIVDRVGGGDSFMGGLIYGLLTYPEDDQKALNFATAASCLKHTIFGDANLVSVKEVEKLMSGDASGRVGR